jgi:deazaflavin-dependent oxidoreductase (nitroreductase family)
MNPFAKLFLNAHVALFRASHGKYGGSMFGGQVLLLTTTGAKTGVPRTVPVMYFEDGGNRLVVASAGGSPRHPAWYKNLAQNPRVGVEVPGAAYPALAEVTSGAERTRLWELVVARQPRFADYAKKTVGREIPVVLLKSAT